MRSDEFEVPVEIPCAAEAIKRTTAAYDKREQARKSIKEAIEAAAENGQYCVEIAGRLPKSIVDELEDLGYCVIYEGDTTPLFWSCCNTVIRWRDVK